MKHLPHHPTVLKNSTCVFCLKEFEGEFTKEHVISRNFVPKGSLDKHWNLIVRACYSCNNGKSDLEDDISAISMAPSVSGEYAEDEKILIDSSLRKSKSISRETKKPVKDSNTAIKLKTRTKGVPVDYVFRGPPAVDPNRVFELCRLQLAAFQYFQTYDESTLKGSHYANPIYPFKFVVRTDWGNKVFSHFADTVEHWDSRFKAGTATGYFRVVIKKHDSKKCWSWAIEWNRNYRIIGFMGDITPIESFIQELQSIDASSKRRVGDSNIIITEETPLEDDDDKLFFGNMSE